MIGHIAIIVTIFLVIGQIMQGISVKSPCKNSDWVYYSKEDVCLQYFMHVAPWDKVREKIRKDKYDLAVIMTYDKQKFLRDNVPLIRPDIKWWIGAYDRNQDGTFFYVNGSVVDNDAPGIGHRTRNATPIFTEDLYAAYLDSVVKYWGYGLRRWRLWSIWEYYPHPKPTLEDPTTCTFEKCPCHRRDWSFFKFSNKFIKVNQVYKNYSDAAKLCEKLGLGAQLLTIENKNIETFITNVSQSWSPRGVLYWIGLRKYGKHFYWKRGDDRLPVGQYTNWFSSPQPNSDCVGVVWQYHSKRKALPCTFKAHHICEVPEPCSATPILLVDNQTRIETNDTVIDLHARKPLKIYCNSTGYTEGVVKTLIRCANRQEATKGIGDATLITVPDFLWHNRNCTCRISMNDARDREIIVKTVFFTPPFVMPKTEDRYSVQTEDNLEVKIKVVANPAPANVTLRKKTSYYLPDGVEISWEPTNNPIIYLVSITVDTFTHVHDGVYILTVADKNNTGMNHSFILEGYVRLKDPEDIVTIGLHVIALGVLTFFGLVSMLVSYCIGKRRDSSSDVNEGSDDQSSGSEDVNQSVDWANWDLTGKEKEDDDDYDDDDDENEMVSEAKWAPSEAKEEKRAKGAKVENTARASEGNEEAALKWENLIKQAMHDSQPDGNSKPSPTTAATLMNYFGRWKS